MVVMERDRLPESELARRFRQHLLAHVDYLPTRWPSTRGRPLELVNGPDPEPGQAASRQCALDGPNLRVVRGHDQDAVATDLFHSIVPITPQAACEHICQSRYLVGLFRRRVRVAPVRYLHDAQAKTRERRVAENLLLVELCDPAQLLRRPPCDGQVQVQVVPVCPLANSGCKASPACMHAHRVIKWWMTVCDGPVMLTVRPSATSATSARICSTAVYVFPVPGGPCRGKYESRSTETSRIAAPAAVSSLATKGFPVREVTATAKRWPRPRVGTLAHHSVAEVAKLLPQLRRPDRPPRSGRRAAARRSPGQPLARSFGPHRPPPTPASLSRSLGQRLSDVCAFVRLFIQTRSSSLRD